ncbi:MAG: hypothetical protein IBJ15_21680 [Alphaproteobacteria bacterium]|nr:hypothetical protein [Alphaproteobacteria bacterium]
MRAADIGVERFDAVDEPDFHQEIECSIDRRRGGRAAIGFQAFEHGISADRAMACPHEFQHPAAQFGETLAALGADFPRGGQGIGDAFAVIVMFGMVMLGGTRRHQTRTPGLDIVYRTL